EIQAATTTAGAAIGTAIAPGIGTAIGAAEREVLKQELSDIGATEAQEVFDAEELNKISLITVSLFTRSYEFISKVANSEKQLEDNELEVFEKMFNDLPEAAKGFEDQAKLYENACLKSAADSQRQ
ncbi:3608_t:CDS:2, partial [Funneliformis geosporum]